MEAWGMIVSIALVLILLQVVIGCHQHLLVANDYFCESGTDHGQRLVGREIFFEFR